MSAMGWSSLTGKPSGLKLVNAGSIHDTDRSVPADVLQEAGDLRVAADVENGLPWQAGLAEVAEPLTVSQQVVGIGQAQRPGVEGIPAPGDAVGVQVPGEGGLVV